MKGMILLCVFFFLAITLLPSSVDSEVCPTVGIYSTTEGTMQAGRASESWCPVGGNLPGQPGNMENAESWDGSTLGTEWILTGMAVDSAGAVEIDNTVDFLGFGDITYSTNYEGGTFWLSKDGAWGDNVNDITGTLTYYNVVTTVTYVAGNRVGATSNINARGIFDDCRMRDAVIDFLIANAVQVWHPDDGGSMPGGYPSLLCSAALGELFQVPCIEMSFQPAVPVEQYSWGAVKGVYR
jgi:hypothetical protein